MKRRAALAAFAAVAAMAAPAAAAFAPPPGAAPTQPDWTQSVVETAEGGFRMGNPDAEVKLVEFVSLSCPHCRIFAEAAHRRLIDDYVRGGRVSLEIRNFVLDPFDTAAAIVSRCAEPRSYFALNDAILAEQEQWAARLAALPGEEIRAIDALPTMEQMARIASLAGLDRIAERHGVAPDRLSACLADANNLTRLTDMRRVAVRLGMAGVPAFLVNGKLVEPHDWRGLKALLKTRLRQVV
jgi:protein-disulfide isomerase